MNKFKATIASLNLVSAILRWPLSMSERQIVSEMNRALDRCDDREYARLYRELVRVRETNRWKGIK